MTVEGVVLAVDALLLLFSNRLFEFADSLLAEEFELELESELEELEVVVEAELLLFSKRLFSAVEPLEESELELPEEFVVAEFSNKLSLSAIATF